MARHTEVARQLLKQGNKKGALLVVKRKKLAEALLEKTVAQLDTVQQLIDSIEYAKVNVQVFEGLKKGALRVGTGRSVGLTHAARGRTRCAQGAQLARVSGRC